MRKRWIALALLLLLLLLPVFLVLSEGGARLAVAFLDRRPDLALELRGGSLLRGLELSQLDWTAADGGSALRIRDLTLAPRWSGACLLSSTVCLERLRASELALRLPPAEDSDQPWELPADLRLPLRVSVDALRVERLTVSREDTELLALEHLAAAVRLRRRGIALTGVAVGHAQGQLAGDLRVDWIDNWPLQAQLRVVAAPGLLPAELPGNWTIQAGGPVRDLSLDLRGGGETGLSLEGRLQLPRTGAVARGEFTARGLEGLSTVRELAPWLQLAAPVSAELEVFPQQQRLRLRSALGGWSDKPLRLDAALRRAGERLSLDTLQLIDDAGTPRLQLSGPLGSPERWAPRLAISASGLSAPADAGLALTLDRVEGQLDLTLEPRGLAWSVPALSTSLRYDGRQLVASGRLAGAADHALFPVGELAGTLDGLPFSYRRDAAGAPAALTLPEGLAGGGLTLSSLSAELRPGATTEIEVTAAGDLAGTLQLDVEESADGATLRVEPFRLRVFEEIIHGNEGLRGEWSRDRAALALAPFCLQLRGLELCSDAASLGASGELRLALDGEERFTSSLSENPYSVFLQGQGDLAVSWTPEGLARAELQLTLPLLNVDPFLGAGTAPPVSWEDVQLSFSADPEGQQLRVDAPSEKFGDLHLDATRRGEALAGTVELRALALAALDDLLPEVELRAGTLTGDLDLSGTLASPRLAGALRLQEGAAALEKQGVELEAVDLRLAGDLDAFRLDGTARLGEGPITVTGECCDAGAMTVTLQGERNRLRLPVGLDALLSPDLTLVADVRSARLSGSVRVHEGLFEQQGALGEGVSVSRDVVRLDEVPRSPARLALSADLRAIIDPGFTLRTALLEATLGGDLRLDAAPEEPVQLFGELQVLGGVMRAYGQALRIDRGSVGFVGDPMNPDLNLSAVRDIRSERLRVGVRVIGTLDAPELTLFSDPQRSERDTLSYLLRGRGPDAGAGADSTAMALSLGTSALNKTGVLEALNKVPGLSGVSLGAEGSDDETAATISAYVGERLFLSYGMGIYEPVNALTARLYLRSRLWLEVVSRLESSFDLYYRFDRE